MVLQVIKIMFVALYALTSSCYAAYASPARPGAAVDGRSPATKRKTPERSATTGLTLGVRGVGIGTPADVDASMLSAGAGAPSTIGSPDGRPCTSGGVLAPSASKRWRAADVQPTRLFGAGSGTGACAIAGEGEKKTKFGPEKTEKHRAHLATSPKSHITKTSPLRLPVVGTESTEALMRIHDFKFVQNGVSSELMTEDYTAVPAEQLVGIARGFYEAVWKAYERLLEPLKCIISGLAIPDKEYDAMCRIIVKQCEMIAKSLPKLDVALAALRNTAIDRLVRLVGCYEGLDICSPAFDAVFNALSSGCVDGFAQLKDHGDDKIRPALESALRHLLKTTKCSYSNGICEYNVSEIRQVSIMHALARALDITAGDDPRLLVVDVDHIERLEITEVVGKPIKVEGGHFLGAAAAIPDIYVGAFTPDSLMTSPACTVGSWYVHRHGGGRSSAVTKYSGVFDASFDHDVLVSFLRQINPVMKATLDSAPVYHYVHNDISYHIMAVAKKDDAGMCYWRTVYPLYVARVVSHKDLIASREQTYFIAESKKIGTYAEVLDVIAKEPARRTRSCGTHIVRGQGAAVGENWVGVRLVYDVVTHELTKSLMIRVSEMSYVLVTDVPDGICNLFEYDAMAKKIESCVSDVRCTASFDSADAGGSSARRGGSGGGGGACA